MILLFITVRLENGAGPDRVATLLHAKLFLPASNGSEFISTRNLHCLSPDERSINVRKTVIVLGVIGYRRLSLVLM